MDLDVVGWLLGLVGQNLWQIDLTLKQVLEGWWQDFSQLSGRCELEELCKTEFWVWLIVLFGFSDGKLRSHYSGLCAPDDPHFWPRP